MTNQISSNVMSKTILTSKEAAEYMGLSMESIYRLTSCKKIPHYKPNGKLIYFNREEVDKWLMQNRVATDEELEGKAESYCMRKGDGL